MMVITSRITCIRIVKYHVTFSCNYVTIYIVLVQLCDTDCHIWDCVCLWRFGRFVVVTGNVELIAEESDRGGEEVEKLLFHPRCGAHAAVTSGGMTAHRPNAADDFNNGVVLTNRRIRPGEMFEVCCHNCSKP